MTSRTIAIAFAASTPFWLVMAGLTLWFGWRVATIAALVLFGCGWATATLVDWRRGNDV